MAPLTMGERECRRHAGLAALCLLLLFAVIWVPEAAVGFVRPEGGARLVRLVLRVAVGAAFLALFILSVKSAWPDPHRYGLGRDGLGPSAALSLLVLAAGLAVTAVLWVRVGAPWRFPDKTRIIVYPVWALLQQVFFLGFFLSRMEGAFRRSTAVLVTGLAFGLIHLPNFPLVGLTLPFGAAYAAIYVRTRNLYPLAIVHGVLGTLLDEVVDLNLVVGPNYWRP